MKKIFILSSLAIALLVSGCGIKRSNVNVETEKATTEDMSTHTHSGFNGNRDNFVSVNERVEYIETYLQNIFFDFDKFFIRSDMQSSIDTNAKILTSQVANPLTVRIEGNTDEWGTDEYNYALGLKRAISVRDALVAKGIDKNKTLLISYGESKPTCVSKTKECWAENRKVTFKMIP